MIGRSRVFFEGTPNRVSREWFPNGVWEPGNPETRNFGFGRRMRDSILGHQKREILELSGGAPGNGRFALPGLDAFGQMDAPTIFAAVDPHADFGLRGGMVDGFFQDEE